MVNNLWMCVLLAALMLCYVKSLNLQPGLPNVPIPPRQTFQNLEHANRLRRVAAESRPVLRVLQPPPMLTRPVEPATTAQYQGPIKRGGPPYLVLQPMNVNKRPRSNRRLVLTLPKDNLQILNAEAISNRGKQFYPTTLTLSLRDTDADDGTKESRFTTTRSYASQIPSPPRQASR